MGWFDSMAAGASAAGGGMGSLAGLGMGSGSPITVQPGQRLPGPFGGVDPSLLNSPQPVPGMPPRDLETGGYNNPTQGHIIDGPSPFPMMPYPGGKDSTGMPLITDNWNPDNRGSGQPINQPMSGFDPVTALRSGSGGSMLGAATNAAAGLPMGSLQSLGGGQLNASGMVNLRGPDGSMKAVPQSDLAHWLSKGATMAMGG